MRPRLLLLLALLAPLPATAEIRLTGDAAMGLTSSSATKNPQAITDLELNLQASRVTDGGLEFGAVIRMDATSPNPTPSAGYFFIQGGN
jgi:hypothetical protein